MSIVVFLVWNKVTRSSKNHRSSASSNNYLSNIQKLSKDTPESLISRDGTGWKVKMMIRLSDDVIWVQLNMVNVNEMDYGRWNIRWNANNEVWTEKNEMKHEQWSADWKKMRWNMNN